MKQSKLFSKTRKEAPREEVALNAQLLTRAGFIYKEMAGVYNFLPLGKRVLDKISNIIRTEMNKIGSMEIQPTVLQKKEVWEPTQRWDDSVVDNWFKTALKNNTKLGLASTHEEPFTVMLRDFVSSYKDLPIYIYELGLVFRNEARAKSGILRGREFLWKALYSFSKDEAEHNVFYEKTKEAYRNVYREVGLEKQTFLTFASGGTFSKYSHEFQALTEAGEDIIYLDEKKKIAVNKEVYQDDVLKDLGLSKDSLVEKKAVEVGNIFSLGDKFSKALDLKYKDDSGKDQIVFMGSYGIGISRLMGTIVEIHNDERGIIWPKSVAPFDVHLISIGQDQAQKAEEIYQKLEKEGVEVLWDDRDISPGEKFADADLIGIPERVVVSEKSLTAGGLEIKNRAESEGKIIPEEEFFQKFSK